MSYTASFINANQAEVIPEKPYVIKVNDKSYEIGNDTVQRGDIIKASIGNTGYESKLKANYFSYSEKYNTVVATENEYNFANKLLAPLSGIDNIIKGEDHQHIINYYCKADLDEFEEGSQIVIMMRFFPVDSYWKLIDRLKSLDCFLYKKEIYTNINQYDVLVFRTIDSKALSLMMEGKYSQLPEYLKQRLMSFNDRSPYIRGVLGIDNEYRKFLATKLDVNQEDIAEELENPLKQSKKLPL